MKPSSTFPTLALSALLATCGLAALPGTAQAVTVHHGTTCRASGESNVGGLFYGLLGAYTGNLQKVIICPLVHTTQGGDFSVLVDFVVNPSINSPAFTCTLTSRDWKSNYLGSNTVVFPTPPVKTIADMTLFLPQSQVPWLSSQTVYCTLPPNSEVFDIEQSY